MLCQCEGEGGQQLDIVRGAILVMRVCFSVSVHILWLKACKGGLVGVVGSLLAWSLLLPLGTSAVQPEVALPWKQAPSVSCIGVWGHIF